MDNDDVIQRLEKTFELAWKTFKIVLEDCRTPNDYSRSVFKIGLIKGEQFLDMLVDRNRISHIYHQEESEKIFSIIKLTYLEQFLQLDKRLRE